LSDLATLIGRPPRPDGYENPRANMRPGRPVADEVTDDLDDDTDDDLEDELEAETEG
jgi:hypothetical protein